MDTLQNPNNNKSNKNPKPEKIKLTQELKEKYYKLKKNYSDSCKTMEILLDFASNDEIKIKCELNLKELIEESFDEEYNEKL